MRKAESVAKYIIAYALKIEHPVRNIQLQKILYYIQVHFLKNTGDSFFKDDIEAWLIGPVIPNVYYQYAVFGPAPITIFNETWQLYYEPDARNVIPQKAMELYG